MKVAVLHAMSREGQHPHVVEFLETYMTKDLRRVLAFGEYDMTLWEVTGKQGVMPFARVQPWVIGLLQAFQHIHSVKVVHRDIKPNNIMLQLRPDWAPLGALASTQGTAWSLQIRVIDFSRARFLPDSSIPGQRIEGMSTGVGSSQYGAPEVVFAKGDEAQYGQPADMWSVGVVIFELLAGEPLIPFTKGIPALFADMRTRMGTLPPARWYCREKASAHTDRTIASYKLPLHKELLQKLLSWEPASRASAEIALVSTQGVTQQATVARADDAAAAPAKAVSVAKGNPASASASAKGVTAEVTAAGVGHAVQGVAAAAKDEEAEDTAASGGDTDVAAAAMAKEVGSEKPALASTQGSAACSFASVFTEPPKPQTCTRRPHKCKCSGHCYQPGHNRHGCSSKLLVVGCQYCTACKCEIPNCLSPRRHGPFCFTHRVVFGSAPWELKAAAASRPLLASIIPCDLTDFVQRWSAYQKHPLLCIIGAMLKEPAATKAWMSTGICESNLDAANLYDSLEKVAVAMDGCPNLQEVDQLTRQGGARWTCVASTCRSFGVIEPSKEGAPCPDAGARTRLCLGKTLQPYVRTNDSRKVASMLEATSTTEVFDLWQEVTKPAEVDFAMAATNVHAILYKVAVMCPGTIPVKGEDAFVRLHIVRNILLAITAHGGARPDWTRMPRSVLERACPDESGCLKVFPDSTTAAEIGVMIFGSPAASMLVSVFACLFKEVGSAATTQEKEEVLARMADGTFKDAAVQMKRATGVAPAPFVISQSLCLVTTGKRPRPEMEKKTTPKMKLVKKQHAQKKMTTDPKTTGQKTKKRPGLCPNAGSGVRPKTLAATQGRS